MNHLIIGYGFLGKALLQRYSNRQCYLIKRSNNLDFSNLRHCLINLDVNDLTSWSGLDCLRDDLTVYFMVPPSQIDLDLFPQFIEKLDQLNIKRRILVSSTVVYGKTEREVDADSEVCLDSERAKRQYEIETIWRNQSSHAAIVRLAGLYGNHRVIGRRQIEQGQVIGGNPKAWLNLIHIDDAAALLECMATLEMVSEIELGSDGAPLRRQDYYSLLARLLNFKSPKFENNSDELGRCCNNELTIARTGWYPKYSDIEVALEHCLNN